LRHFFRAPFGDEGGATFATGPRHDGIIFGGGFCDRLDEACIGFHVLVLGFVSGAGLVLPLLDPEYDEAIGPVLGNCIKSLENARSMGAWNVATRPYLLKAL
jgi:hypothetical protein